MEIPQLQYTAKVVDVNAESSEDSADAAGPGSSRSWLTTLCSCEQVPAVQVQQRIVEMPQIQVPAIRQSGEHSSCATDSVNARCRATRKIHKVVETTQVQFKEMNLQYRHGCRPSRRSQTLLRSYTLCYRDRCRTSRKLTRYRRRSSCRGDARQPVVQ